MLLTGFIRVSIGLMTILYIWGQMMTFRTRICLRETDDRAFCGAGADA